MTLTDSDREAILEAWSAAYPYAPLKRSAPFPPGIEESYLAGFAAGAKRERERCAKVCDEYPEFEP